MSEYGLPMVLGAVFVVSLVVIVFAISETARSPVEWQRDEVCRVAYALSDSRSDTLRVVREAPGCSVLLAKGVDA